MRAELFCHVSTLQVQNEVRDTADHESVLTHSPDVINRTSWLEARGTKEDDESPSVGGVSAGRQAMCHLLVPPRERSGRETPISVDSIPLEWDHTVDVGGSSSSHEDDEDATFFSALSGKNKDPTLLYEPSPPHL